MSSAGTLWCSMMWAKQVFLLYKRDSKDDYSFHMSQCIDHMCQNQILSCFSSSFVTTKKTPTVMLSPGWHFHQVSRFFHLIIPAAVLLFEAWKNGGSYPKKDNNIYKQNMLWNTMGIIPWDQELNPYPSDKLALTNVFLFYILSLHLENTGDSKG